MKFEKDDKIAEFFSLKAQEFQAENPTQFTRDRSKSVGASEVFKCPRYVWFTKQEIRKQQEENSPTPPNPNGGYMMRGKIIEDNFLAPLFRWAFGDEAEHLGDEQETLVAPDCEWLTATPDGIIKDPITGEKVLVEFKTHDPRSVMNEPKPEHVLQTHVQMGITGIHTTLLTYVNASDVFNFTVFRIKFDPVIYEEAKKNARMIMEVKNPEDLNVINAVIRGECLYCKWRKEGKCNGQ